MFFTRKPPSDNIGAPSTGAMAEELAAIFLQKQGLVIHTKNYRCKLGEIDLIMQHADTLVFIEVRLRTHQAFANAAESITIHKQQKIIKAAQYYLQQHQLTDKVNCRFDVVAFGNSSTPEWIKNAFSAY
jgi:putative endonuclease